MKLAELLAERKSLVDRINTIKEDLRNNVYVKKEESADAAEESETLFDAYLKAYDEYIYLSSVLSKVNANTKVKGTNMTIVECIEERKMYMDRVNLYTALLNRTRDDIFGRMDRNGVDSVCAFDKKALRASRDMISAKVRKLDVVLQETNWTTEVVVEDPKEDVDIISLVGKRNSKIVSVIENVDNDDDEGIIEEIRPKINTEDPFKRKSSETKAEKKKREREEHIKDVLRDEFGLGEDPDADDECPVFNSGYARQVDEIYAQTGSLVRVVEFLDSHNTKIAARDVRAYLDRHHPGK
jgi:hypothetical protein